MDNSLVWQTWNQGKSEYKYNKSLLATILKAKDVQMFDKGPGQCHLFCLFPFTFLLN